MRNIYLCMREFGHNFGKFDLNLVNLDYIWQTQDWQQMVVWLVWPLALAWLVKVNIDNAWHCIRSGATWCTLSMVINLCRMCQCGLQRCSGRKSVYLYASSMQNQAVPKNLYCSLSVPVERFRYSETSRFRTGELQEQAQYFFVCLCCSIPFCLLLFSFSLLSVCRLILWGWGSLDWYGEDHSTSLTLRPH